MRRRGLRALTLGGTIAATVLAGPVPAFASGSSGAAHPPLHLEVELPAVTLILGQQAVPSSHQVVLAGRATHLVRKAPTPRHRASAARPVAVTAPGLISVVPVGPMPSALRPRVASPTVRAVAQRIGPASSSLPAPPVGFWFTLVLLVLLFGSATYVIGDRRAGYRVAVSITKR